MHHCIMEIRIELIAKRLYRLNLNALQNCHKLFVDLFHSLNERVFFFLFRNCI